MEGLARIWELYEVAHSVPEYGMRTPLNPIDRMEISMMKTMMMMMTFLASPQGTGRNFDDSTHTYRFHSGG